MAEQFVPWGPHWPPNVWLGTTVESQRWAERRIECLIGMPARVHFLSCEPLLSRLDLSQWLVSLDWVIAGGESGPRARPTDPDWFRELRDQCVAARVPFHFKQWGNWAPLNGEAARGRTFRLASGEMMTRVNKGTAGRKLDGQFWDEVPIR